MSDPSLLKKLRMTGARRALILNAPAEYMPGLGELPTGLVVASEAAARKFDFVHLFARNRSELERFVPAALAAAAEDAVIWLSYPKRTSGVDTDLNRDSGWEVVYASGLRPVTQVAIDEVWSALRFRPVEKVGKPWPPATNEGGS